MAEKRIVSIGDLKKGDTIIIEGSPCKIFKMQVSRPGKHGHAKVRLEAVGLIDKKKKITVMPGHEKVEQPIIHKKNAQVLSVSGDKANLMDMETYETFDLEIPGELKDQVNDGVQVLYWDILGHKIMKQVKGGG